MDKIVIFQFYGSFNNFPVPLFERGSSLGKNDDITLNCSERCLTRNEENRELCNEREREKNTKNIETEMHQSIEQLRGCD